jgi:hypothetical protein
MPTTTNYGWTTPADTDLVKDGASAIRTLGTAIDTTVFNNASAGIAKTIVDAKGDIIAATAADTVSRLAVGSNDQVLTADSSTATGLKWAAPSAGGMTLISTTSLSGTSVTLSSIPQTYVHLQLVIVGNYTNFGFEGLAIRFNGDSTSNRHYEGGVYGNLSGAVPASTKIKVTVDIKTGVTNSLCVVDIPYYTSTTTRKFLSGMSMGQDGNTTTNSGTRFTNGFYNQDGATTSLVVLSQDGGTFQAGTVYLYGVK